MDTEPTQTPSDLEDGISQYRKGRSARLYGIVTILLLILIVAGGVIITVRARNTPSGNPVMVTTPPPAPKSWCVAPQVFENLASTSISGLAANDIWSAGQNITHWDGNKWNIALKPPASQERFSKILEIAPDDVWAVGVYTAPGAFSDSRFTAHWNGTSWQINNLPPVAGSGQTQLQAISGTSAADVWVVGYTIPKPGTGIGTSIIDHWDGKSWSSITHPNPSGGIQLTGVIAFAPDDAWTVGFGYSTIGTMNVHLPLIEHWDGVQWKTMKSPGLPSGGDFNSISGSSPKDLWAVGSANDGMLAEHWNGKAWSVVTTSTIPLDKGDELESVIDSSPDDVWAVGRYHINSTFHPVIEYWNGHQWQVAQDTTGNAGELTSVTLVGNQLLATGIPDALGGQLLFEAPCS